MNARPVGLTDEQLSAIMVATRAIRRSHRCWVLHTILAELSDTRDINAAIHAALSRLQQHEVEVAA